MAHGVGRFSVGLAGLWNCCRNPLGHFAEGAGMNIEQLSEQADELADKKIGMPGEHHPDWHTVRDEIFADLVRNEALEEAAVKCDGMFAYRGGHGEPGLPSGSDVVAAIRSMKEVKT
jgi:hypothetical protein